MGPLEPGRGWAKAASLQVKGPLDTSNFDDFSGIDEKFVIQNERHKACKTAWTLFFKISFGAHESTQLANLAWQVTEDRTSLAALGSQDCDSKC